MVNDITAAPRPDQRSRGSTADAIALVRALGVVVPHEAIEGPLQRRARREVAAPEHHAPVLLENRALQAFDEAVGPGVARFGARVPEVELAAGRIKRPLELGSTIGEDAAHWPPGASVVRDDDLAQSVKSDQTRSAEALISIRVSRWYIAS